MRNNIVLPGPLDGIGLIVNQPRSTISILFPYSYPLIFSLLLLLLVSSFYLPHIGGGNNQNLLIEYNTVYGASEACIRINSAGSNIVISSWLFALSIFIFLY